MVCLACREFSARVMCRRCAASLEPAPDRFLSPGLMVRSAWRHDRAGRALVHRLKYDGVTASATVLARAMVPLLDARRHRTVALVPVPRTTVRRIRYGVDPGRDLARALARLTGIPMLPALRSAPVAPTHAGRSREERPAPRLTLRRPVPNGSVLVDDVVTTGTTLRAAAALLGNRCHLAVTATSALEINSSWCPERSKDTCN